MRASKILIYSLLTVVSLVSTNYAADPGLPYSAMSEASNQKTGSVSFYNVYTSKSAAPSQENTRINLTNTSEKTSAFVRLFFVQGSTGSSVDSFVCLAPNQTISFLASDIDPDVKGYVMAVAIDGDSGRPIKFNHLMGDYYVKFASGHAANLRAEAFSAIADNPAVLSENGAKATIYFDGHKYNSAPGRIALSGFRSPYSTAAEQSLIILVRLGGFGQDCNSQTFMLQGLLFDDKENAAKFSHLVIGNHLIRPISNEFPRTMPQLSRMILNDCGGWIEFWTGGNEGLLGSAITFSLNASNSASAFNGGHNLHHLSLTNSASITIPLLSFPL